MERLLVVSNMYPSPKAPYFGVFVQRQVRALQAHGVDVALAVSDRRGGSVAGAARKYAALGLDAHRVAKRSHPWAVLAHFVFPSGVIALSAGRTARAPVALVAHGGDVDPNKPAWVARATREVLARVDLLLAVSRSIAGEAQAAGADPERIAIASMGYDADAFVPRPRPEARTRLGIPEGRQLAVMVGNLIPRKGVGVIVDAAAALAPAHPDLQWVLVGGGDQARWRAQAERAGSAAAIRFTGPADPEDVPWWLSAADVAVVPSLREPYGVAAVEALACGVPVVASRTGGLAEIMDGDHGLTVEPGDAASPSGAPPRR
ncbi:MAG TPA: glycosyltransferase [Actinomycetota bacterium]|nr:glycosyltransferase [Actinomycetota bacterium]